MPIGNNLIKVHIVLSGGVETAFELKGVSAAFTTPFKKDDSIDEEALRRDIQYLEARIHGLVSCPTPGEKVMEELDLGLT